MAKTIVIAAGGTGGHLFPAQRVAKRLYEESDNTVIFMGKGLATNPRFTREFPFHDIASASFAGNPITLVRNSLQLAKGLYDSIRTLKKIAPALVVGFGSYHGAPILLAAWLLSIPIILHESNAVPGKVNRLFSRMAQKTAVFFEQAATQLVGEVVRSDIPLKKEFHESMRPTREQALEYYGLESDLKTLLVFGGSQGAQRMNALFIAALSFLDCTGWQILHFTGADTAFAQEYATRGIRAVVKPFEQKMEMAYVLADGCISRSGAATIAEQMAFGLPAFFIPYPTAADNHQEHNARFVEKIGAACCFLEEQLDARLLAAKLTQFLEDASLQTMRKHLVAHRLASDGVDFCEEIRRFLS